LILKEFSQIVLVVAGGGPLEQLLLLEAKSLGINDSIQFLGFRMDMAEILPIFDVYVLPSLWEGLPLVVLEAMAASKPVVATAVGGTPTAVLNGETGLTVPPKDPAELAKAIMAVLHDSRKAAGFGAKGHQYYLSNFTVHKMVSKYQSLYLNCFSK